MIRKLILGVALCCANFYLQAVPTLLVVDWLGRPPYYYRNLLLFARDAGFDLQYRSLYDFLEQPNADDFDALFFMLPPAFASKPLPKKLSCQIRKRKQFDWQEPLLNGLISFAQQNNKGLVLALPNIRYNPEMQQQTYENCCAIAHLKEWPEAAHRSLSIFISGITQSDSKIGVLFGTGLLNKSLDTEPLIQILSSSFLQFLPRCNGEFSKTAQKTFPVATLLKDPQTNSAIMITKSSIFDFADIAEQFFKNPIALSDRNEVLKAAKNAMDQFSFTLQTGSSDPCPSSGLPELLTPAFAATKQKAQKRNLSPAYHWLDKPGISCAWIDPYDYFAHEDSAKKMYKLAEIKGIPEEKRKSFVEDLALYRGIKNLHDGNFSFIWFEFLPEWYLHENGMRKAHREEYCDRIERIGAMLKKYYHRKGTPLPKIFLGVNLTSNFKSNFVANPVRTLSGTTLPKIPSPFDLDHFWHPEVIDIVGSFVKKFKTALPIDGVFLDFEMYHAQNQTGQYTDHMDFSDLAWRTYCTASDDDAAAKIKSFSKRMAHLQKEKKFERYFKVLTKEAEKIGLILKRAFRTHVPNAIIGAYAPSLPLSWFYRGIEAGLSSPSEPLLLATFNTDYITHDSYLKKLNIHLLHGTAMMMSKLQDEQDFSLISDLCKYHDFIWYNRPSRMVYQYNQKELDHAWWGIEATCAPAAITLQSIAKTHRKIQTEKQ